MEKFLNDYKKVEKFSNLRCEIYRKERPIEELAVITYRKERK